MRIVITYLIGLTFGLGIMISGMANPAKVLNFFDVAGTWDPSLIFVMGGALVVTFIGYRLIFGKGPKKPVMDETFQIPQNRTIDTRLLGGSAVFGLGWGIAGFCPGGALPAVGSLKPEVLIFAAALIAGIFIAKALQARAHS
ncbi:DUF6691 family protein [Roseovarius sp. MMSF_3281]|uniref:DUF6691 family protein n=1 Tax=Roseovarius sp. MMSF_3281 TaxID=3046694 RepID=UPI00273F9AF5|nr:DUF6691 family protein [Roseovarius sp. MMSF_3281]